MSCPPRATPHRQPRCPSLPPRQARRDSANIARQSPPGATTWPATYNAICRELAGSYMPIYEGEGETRSSLALAQAVRVLCRASEAIVCSSKLPTRHRCYSKNDIIIPKTPSPGRARTGPRAPNAGPSSAGRCTHVHYPRDRGTPPLELF